MRERLASSRAAKAPREPYACAVISKPGLSRLFCPRQNPRDLNANTPTGWPPTSRLTHSAWTSWRHWLRPLLWSFVADHVRPPDPERTRWRFTPNVCPCKSVLGIRAESSRIVPGFPHDIGRHPESVEYRVTQFRRQSPPDACAWPRFPRSEVAIELRTVWAV